MPFSYATAITRLSGGRKPVFDASWTADQKLQRLNEALERIFEFGEWRGLKDAISMSAVSGIITLSAAYQRLDALGYADFNMVVPIKSQQWAFSNAGPRPQDWTLYSRVVAIDQGETAAGLRNYLITGGAGISNTFYTATVAGFTGLARKRYSWVTDTTVNVFPDSYQALRLAAISLNREDEGDDSRCAQKFADALGVLNGNLSETDVEDKQVVTNYLSSGANIRNIV